MPARAELGSRGPAWAPFSGSEAGQGLVELALALPVLLAVASAIIDGAWAFHQAGLVAAAAEAAQRAVAIEDTGAGHCAGAPPAAYAESAQTAARAAAPSLDAARLSIAIEYLEPACTGRMRTLAVSIRYPVAALTPWLAPLLGGRWLTGQAASAVEELPPPWWGQADQVRAQQAEIASQQAQIASLTSAYNQEAAQLAAQQAEIARLVSASSYYYGQWQAALRTTGAWPPGPIGADAIGDGAR